MPLGHMALQPVHLFPNSLDILPKSLQILTILSTASTLTQLPQLSLLILQERKRLLLNENPVGPAIMARAIPSSVGGFIGGAQLLLQLRKLTAQPYLLPLLVLDRVAEICSLGLV